MVNGANHCLKYLNTSPSPKYQKAMPAIATRSTIFQTVSPLPLQPFRYLRHEVDDGDQQQDADHHNRDHPRHGPASPLARLLVAGQHIVRALPGRHEIERAEFLLQLDRLVDDALGLVVVANLDEAGQRKILAQRMALEAVVGEQPAQIRDDRRTGCRRGRRPRARTSRRRERRRSPTAPSSPRRFRP